MILKIKYGVVLTQEGHTENPFSLIQKRGGFHFENGEAFIILAVDVELGRKWERLIGDSNLDGGQSIDGITIKDVYSFVVILSSQS